MSTGFSFVQSYALLAHNNSVEYEKSVVVLHYPVLTGSCSVLVWRRHPTASNTILTLLALLKVVFKNFSLSDNHSDNHNEHCSIYLSLVGRWTYNQLVASSTPDYVLPG